MDPILVGVISTILSLWLGSIEVRMRHLNGELRNVPSRKEVSREIDLKQASIEVMQNEIKEDIHEMKRALEKLADKQN